MDIGKTISEARRNAGLSQAGLAARLTMLGVDVTNQAVCKWENGSTLPNARQFIILCAALGIDDVLGEFTNGKYGAYALVAIRMADALINAITREPVVSFISS